MLFILAAAVVAAAPAMCPALATDYDNVSKDLAEASASSVGDNSVYRSMDRKLDGVMAMERARLDADLMRDHHCAMPVKAPNEIDYLSPALTCATDRLKAGTGPSPASCDRKTWTPLTR